MSLQYSPKIITDSLVMCLDASQNKSYPTSDLPVKDGLLLWLDASDDSTFSYSSGTEVSQWRDKSGNNFHANELQAVGNKPSRNTVVNGRKSLNFTSTEGDRLRVNSGMVFTNSVTAIVFIKPGSQNYAYANILDQDHAMSGQANGWVIQRNNVSSAWQSWVSNSAGDNWFNPNQVSYTDNTPQIVTLRKGSSTITLYNNGTTSGDVSVADQQIRQANYFGLNIGSWRAGGFSDRHYNGEICEIVVYNRALSLTELKQVHTYLGQKWGISNTDRSIIDLSGNNNHGLLGNGTVANMPDYDYYNQGTLSFSQTSNDTVLTPLPITATPALSNFTYEVWTKLNRYPPIVSPPNGYGVTYRSGFLFGASYYGGAGLLWYGNTNGDAFSLYAFIRATDAYRNTNAYSFNTNQYYHCVMVNNYSANKLQLFINGTLYSEVATATAQYDASNASAAGNIGISKAQIDGGGTANYSYYDGVVPVARIYNKALSATEVLQNYEAQKSKFANTIVQQGLVLNLDAGNPYSYAGAGSTWYDVSGNSFNATLIKTPIYSSDNGGVLNWNGVDQYTTVPMSSTLRVTNITQEVWVYLSSTADQVFIGMQYGTGSSNSFALWLSGGTFYFGVNTGGTFYQSSFSTPSVGVWYHLVHTYGGSSQSLYINGSLVGTYSSAATGNITYDVNNTKLAIGADFNGTGYDTGPTLFVNGKMPIVKIYNISLSAAQVLQNYNATKGRFGL